MDIDLGNPPSDSDTKDFYLPFSISLWFAAKIESNYKLKNNILSTYWLSNNFSGRENT